MGRRTASEGDGDGDDLVGFGSVWTGGLSEVAGEGGGLEAVLQGLKSREWWCVLSDGSSRGQMITHRHVPYSSGYLLF